MLVDLLLCIITQYSQTTIPEDVRVQYGLKCDYNIMKEAFWLSIFGLLLSLGGSVVPKDDAGLDEDIEALPKWIAAIDTAKMTDSQRDGILWEEKKQRKRLRRISDAVEAGEKTILSKLPALHDLGRVLYKLDRFEDALGISRDIAQIYSDEYGEIDRRTISAVINVASTLNRLERYEECHAIMKNIFPAQLDRYGLGSKEVSFHIGLLIPFLLLTMFNFKL